ncbi:MAG: hypothetical protein HY234_03660 [Acidobacteria bacterium]|nr:hypothetical protein [Acidobacteriota bacterium]MBI3662133.1 hypothetical protein [Acidobacteriota bacterium]
MAILLEIDNGDNRGRVNYTRYLISPEQSPVVLRDRMNLPSLFDFSLAPADAQFVPPRRTAYVRVTGLADALPPGGPRVPGPLFTGYVTNEPAIEFLGARSGGPVDGYRFQATSEEYLLNIKRLGIVPPFLNQTAGQILRMLTERLQPGRFDTTGTADGAVIPFYAPAPEGSWSEIARELAERSGFAYHVLDGKIYFDAVATQSAGIVIDERDRRFRPESLEVSPLGNPIQNDVTILGGVEPQAYVTECFAGDGFTSRFTLAAPVFGAASSLLLADDFAGLSIDSGRWQELDPASHIQIFEGRLNVTGGTGTLGETALLARQAIELGGELELLHGEYEFTAPSAGILGGLYSAAALAPAYCLLGFEILAVSSTSRIRPLISGTAQPAEVLVQANHHYVLLTRLSADRAHRIEQTFSSLSSSFGGASLPANIKVTLVVRDIDLTNPAQPLDTVLHESTLAALPAFAFYAPANSADLHMVANFLQVTQPIQASLVTQAPGGVPRTRALGFGIAGQDATITADPHQNQWALEFYEDTIPARGEKITLRYRATGRARARVRDAASIVAEAALAGDDGVRAAVLGEFNPMPRTSAEAELAAQAYLADHTAPRYEGRYATWGEFADAFPRSGHLLDVRNESCYPAFTALVRSVTSELHEIETERILHTLEFGQPSRFEDLLRHFAPPENILGPREELPLDPLDSAQVGSAYLSDAPGLTLASTSPTYFSVNMGAAPPAGGRYEARRGDQGWSTDAAPGTAQNLLGTFASANLLLPRTARNHAFYIRPVDAAGATSRFSSVLAAHYPLVPATPLSLAVRFGADAGGKPIISAGVALDAWNVADVDRVELRDSDGVTILAQWDFGQLRLEEGSLRAGLILDNSVSLIRSKALYAYTQNALGEYSAARSATASVLQPAKPSLSSGNSVGQILEIMLDRVVDDIVGTQIQVIGPGGSFTAPWQDILLPGQPDKFSFVAPQSGGWEFRARRRDAIGWSPWSNEPQGQIPAQSLVFAVHFFEAHELDPSVGAAINTQNLLGNSDFFLTGVAGQEGTHVARYFALVNAAASGSEADLSAATNEMQWKSGVNFAAANPGFRSLYSNLGKLFNPGEPLTLSAALRHNGTGTLAAAVRFALRSASTPAFDQTKDVAAGTITGTYQWYSVTFTLPVSSAVPADLAVEFTVVAAVGQSLASSLFCDKVILNRGHRPAAFSLALWDVLALAWNAAAGAYDLPVTALAVTPRSSDPGSAGLLSGTGTEDLDPNFTSRFFRATA